MCFPWCSQCFLLKSALFQGYIAYIAFLWVQWSQIPRFQVNSINFHIQTLWCFSLNFINLGTSTHLNSSRPICEPWCWNIYLQNWLMYLWGKCWDSDSSTMLRTWAAKNPHEASRRSSTWPWGEGPSGRGSGVGGDRGALSLGSAWQVYMGLPWFTMV